MPTSNLYWNDQGTPVSQRFDDVYFSNENGLKESRYVFFDNNALETRWQQNHKKQFTIAETGFGTGLNFLMAYQAFIEKEEKNIERLFFISFEKYPLTKHELQQAHQCWPELQPYTQKFLNAYPEVASGTHRIILEQGKVVLDLWFGDIHKTLPNVHPQQGLVDAWFLDGFAPSKNPDMWQPSLFEQMARLSYQGTTFATFTAAGIVKQGLLAAGFHFDKVKGFGKKRDMLRGFYKQTNSSEALLAPRVTRQGKRVAVVGGGIASMNALVSLQERSIQADLFCKDKTLAEGASGNPQGAVYPLLQANDDELSWWFIQSFLFMLQRTKQLHQTYSIAHNFSGLLQLGFDKKTIEKNKRLAEKFSLDSFLTYVSVNRAAEISGIPLKHDGLYFPRGGWINPKDYIEACRQHTNPSIHFEQHVISIEKDENAWWLITPEDKRFGPYDSVILANGHTVTDFEQSKSLPLRPVRGQVSFMDTIHSLSKLKTVLCSQGYVTPQLHNTHCFGASYDRHNLICEYNEREQQQNIEKLTGIIGTENQPVFEKLAMNRARNSIRMNSRDHLPYVGALMKGNSVLPGLYILSGFGSRGLTTSALAAEVLVSELCGEPLPANINQLFNIHPHRIDIRKQLKTALKK